MAVSVGLIVGIILLVLILIWYVMTYNRLVRLRNECDRAWSNIEVLLQQRYDMLPNLQEIVKGYAKHEKDIFMEFAEIRRISASVGSGDVAGYGQAEGMLATMMPKIQAIAEAYPELKADSSFVNLQKELVAIENQVSDRREFYNSAVTNWNIAIEQMPANFVAMTMGARRKDQFVVQTEMARQAVTLDFTS
ncbi:MAG: LemA family protein [Candidatus Thalassarchaeaceae archaeon]|jgi:LemA protein|nr:LemA family protein [Candidatus Thalassarchaeaceae archaeon]